MQQHRHCRRWWSNGLYVPFYLHNQQQPQPIRVEDGDPSWCFNFRAEWEIFLFLLHLTVMDDKISNCLISQNKNYAIMLRWSIERVGIRYTVAAATIEVKRRDWWLNRIYSGSMYTNKRTVTDKLSRQRLNCHYTIGNKRRKKEEMPLIEVIK